MNTIAYKFFMLAMVLMMSVAGDSHDAFINGVYYNLDNSTKKATVTYKGDMLTRGLSPCAKKKMANLPLIRNTYTCMNSATIYKVKNMDGGICLVLVFPVYGVQLKITGNMFHTMERPMCQNITPIGLKFMLT